MGFVLGWLSFLLLGLMLPSYLLWVNPWMIQQEYGSGLDSASMTFWDRMRWLYVLGPEVVVALAAIIVSLITLARWGSLRALQQEGWMVTWRLICAWSALGIFGSILLLGVLLFAGAT